MSQFYNEMAAVADELITEFGVAMTVIRTEDDDSQTVRTTVGLILDPMTYRTRPVELSAIDRRGICVRLFKDVNGVVDPNFLIKDTDRIQIYGNWIITRVDPVRPADTLLAVRFEMRPG